MKNVRQGGGLLGRYRFTKSDRLLKRVEFIRISRSGRKRQNQHFIAMTSPARLEQPRLGITVTKKVGNAVARNRIKRYVREFYRLNRQEIDGRHDVNIIAKKAAASLAYEEMFNALHDLMAKISG